MICSYLPRQESLALGEASLVQRHTTHEMSVLSDYRSQRPSQTKLARISTRVLAGGVTRLSMCTTSPQTSNNSIERTSDRLRRPSTAHVNVRFQKVNYVT